VYVWMHPGVHVHGAMHVGRPIHLAVSRYLCVVWTGGSPLGARELEDQGYSELDSPEGSHSSDRRDPRGSEDALKQSRLARVCTRAEYIYMCASVHV
jgi:hypothetical protein